jgi:hypothetical protein
MATAILDILDPNVWPVIDIWAAKTVFGAVPSCYCAACYAAYAKHLAIEGARCWGADLLIHELDEKAQSASMRGQLPVGWRRATPPLAHDGTSGPTTRDSPGSLHIVGAADSPLPGTPTRTWTATM